MTASNITRSSKISFNCLAVLIGFLYKSAAFFTPVGSFIVPHRLASKNSLQRRTNGSNSEQVTLNDPRVSSIKIKLPRRRDINHYLKESSLRLSKQSIGQQRHKKCRGASRKQLDDSQIATIRFNKNLKEQAQGPRRLAAETAEKTLYNALKRLDDEQTSRESDGKQEDFARPDHISFNMVINAYAHKSRRDPRAPQKAMKILKKMKDVSEKLKIYPTDYSYNGVINAFSNSRTPDSAQKAYEVLQMLKNDPVAPLTNFSYNLVLKACANGSSGGKQVLELAERIFEELIHSDDVKPDNFSYGTMALVYNRHKKPIKAEALLDRMVSESGISPDQVIFNTVIDAWCKSDSAEVGLRADALLERMRHANDPHHVVQPNEATYNSVMNAHAILGNSKRVLDLMEEMKSSSSGVSPDAISYAMVLKSLAHNTDTTIIDAAQIATDVFAQMKEMYNEKGQAEFQPKTQEYLWVIQAWSRSPRRDRMSMAENVLRDMLEDYLGGNKNAKPNAVVYGVLINMLANANNHGFLIEDAGKRAEQLLGEMEQLYAEGVEDMNPGIIVYNSILNVWAKSGHRKGFENAEALLNRMERLYREGDTSIHPDVVSFTCLMDAYSKCGVKNAGERCEELIERMETLHQLGIPSLEPDRTVYNAALNAIAKSGQPDAPERAERLLKAMERLAEEGNESMRPDIITFSIIIDAYTKSGSPDSSWRAEELLEFVEEKYREGDTSMEPTDVFYSGILHAWARTEQVTGAEKAEKLLRRNIELHRQGHHYAKPTVLVYNGVLDAIARSGNENPRASETADALFAEMEMIYLAGDADMRPTRRSFNAVLFSYRFDPDGADKAEKLLQRMDELADGGSYDLRPDFVIYNCALGALAESSFPKVAQRAQLLFDHMKKLYQNGNRAARPNSNTYYALIRAWYKSPEYEIAPERAYSVLKEFFAFADIESDDDEVQQLLTPSILMVVEMFQQRGEGGQEMVGELLERIGPDRSGQSVNPDEQLIDAISIE